MKQLQKYCGFAAFLSFCLGCGFLLLVPGNPFLWEFSWLLSGILLIVLAVWRREAMAYYFFHRNTRYGANLAAIALMSIGILAAVNYIGANYRKRVDLTRARRFTLSEQSQKVISALDLPLKIVHFSQPNGADFIRAQDLLKIFKHSSSKISTETYPLLANPMLAKTMGIGNANPGDQIFAVTKQTAAGEAPQKPVVVYGVSEEKLINGIVRLVKSQNQTVYFLTGHSERSFADRTPANSLSDLKRLIENEVFTVQSLSLAETGKIPEDATVLLIAGPLGQFFPAELELIRKWVQAGGKLFVSLDVELKQERLPPGAKQISDWLKEYGLLTGEKLLFDQTSKFYNVDASVIAAMADSSSHEITKDFPRTQMQTKFRGQFFLPYAIRLYLADRIPDGVQVDSLLRSSPAAWEESSWQQVRSGVVRFDRGQDSQGAMSLAYAIEPKEKKSWRIVVFGSSGFLTNGAVNAENNKDIVLNSINWLANQEGMISVRPNETKDFALSIDANVYNFIILILMIVIPVSILGTGIWGWLQRRAK